MKPYGWLLASLSLTTATWLILSASVTEAAGLEPAGIWMRGDDNAKVDIGPCQVDGVSKICATNLWIKDSSKGEAVGDRLIMTMKWTADNKLTGEAYDPKRDRSYSIVMTIGSDRMTTRGCVFLGLLCKTVSWKRLNQ